MKPSPDLDRATLKFWKGEKLRQLRAVAPCDCGCDQRDGQHDGWPGYLTASDADGNGFTLWIKSPELFAALQAEVSP